MIYTCDTKCCHFIFFGSAETRVCPDCGKHSIRPSTLEERAAFFRRQIEFAQKIRQYRIIEQERFTSKFCVLIRRGFAVILCVLP